MIHVGAANSELSPAWLSSGGGFLWWYLDLIDEKGNGFVLIWSFGLPFLPGYKSRALGGRAQPPRERPSINCVYYRDGRPEFYSLEEYPPEDVQWEPGVWSFGRSRIESLVRGNVRTLRADLHVPLPGSKQAARCIVDAEGPVFCFDDLPGDLRLESAARHNWVPWFAPGKGHARIFHGTRELGSVRGRAYHDRNGGEVPLHALGIRHWIWGRIPHRRGERIVYMLWPEGSQASAPLVIGIEADMEGQARFVPGLRVQTRDKRVAPFGMPWWKSITLHDARSTWLDLAVSPPCENGPFYLRNLVRSQHGLGTLELCRPGRVDSAPFRPLVRMRVHTPGGANSMWLPIFHGPRQGRALRFLRRSR